MIPVTLLSGYLGAGKTTLLNDILHDPKGLTLVILVNEFGDINIDMELIRESSKDAIALTNGCACCAINDDLTGALASIASREVPPDGVIIEASGVANLGRLKQAPANYPGFRVTQGITLVDACSINRLLKDKFVSTTVRDQILDADKLMLTKTDLVESRFSLRDFIGDTESLPSLIKREFFLDNLAEQLTTEFEFNENLRPAPYGHASHQQFWIALETVTMEGLRCFLASPPPGIARIKGFVSVDERHYLVQWDNSGFSITESNENSSPSGLQVIGSPGMDKLKVQSALRKLAPENSSPPARVKLPHAPSLIR